MTEEKKDKMIGELLFETNDLGLATYLRLEGMELKNMSKVRGKTVFCFIDRENRKKLVQDYFGGKARVDPLLYKNLLRDLKIFTINNG